MFQPLLSGLTGTDASTPPACSPRCWTGVAPGLPGSRFATLEHRPARRRSLRTPALSVQRVPILVSGKRLAISPIQREAPLASVAVQRAVPAPTCRRMTSTRGRTAEYPLQQHATGQRAGGNAVRGYHRLPERPYRRTDLRGAHPRPGSTWTIHPVDAAHSTLTIVAAQGMEPVQGLGDAALLEATFCGINFMPLSLRPTDGRRKPGSDVLSW
jgi:virulence-associated protein VagC